MAESVHPARILVVDDDPQVCSMMRQVLAREGFGVLVAADGPSALEVVARERPDLVLLDLVMPGMDGMEVLRTLKTRESSDFLPIILLTGQGDMDTRLRGLKLGADDYLTKPASPRELLARVDALLRIKRMQEQINSSRKQFEDAALVDPVTGLYNQRYLEHRVRDEHKRAERYSEPLSCILLQAVDLEVLRAEHGAEAADACLRELAQVVRRGVREFDVVVRRDERAFAVLLPRTHFGAATAVVGRLWRQAREHPFQVAGRQVAFRVRMGVSFYPGRGVNDGPSLLARAQEALGLALDQPGESICLLQYTPYFLSPD
ncbi:MAG TPA: response regulator [Myxococcota bacterium]|nr:response regulator [Myxococcota bacterium]HRY95264.1 response regulator [Myxococcota bacterium]HSA22429.1 response regulator [Myxococcota bacterium]